MIPFGNKLKAYFRKFESAGNQLQKAIEQLYAARDSVQLDIADIEATRGKLWESMQKLAAAARFATRRQRLAERARRSKSCRSDAPRPRAEVLLCRQNCRPSSPAGRLVNATSPLRAEKTGREMMN